ncbi:MAG: hypothetical protein P8X74_17070 [Reinekea sp.]
MSEKIGLYDERDPTYKVYSEYNQTWGPLNNRIIIGAKNMIFFVYDEDLEPVHGRIRSTQFELPIKALEWLMLVMARFKLPSDKGGYPNDQFTDFLQLGKNVDLSVFRGLHHGLGEMCFMIENRALTTYATEDNTQSWDIYDRDVTEHNLLPVFQKIIDDYHQK